MIQKLPTSKERRDLLWKMDKLQQDWLSEIWKTNEELIEDARRDSPCSVLVNSSEKSVVKLLSNK